VDASRVSLYRALSQDGNPTLNTFNSIVASLNLDVSFRPRIATAPKALLGKDSTAPEQSLLEQENDPSTRAASDVNSRAGGV
jgi:hypothetical protein